MKDSGWKYYLPDAGEGAQDAIPLRICEHQCISDPDDAAAFAAEDEWDNRDGWEVGIGAGPPIVVIAPDGSEFRFLTHREAEVRHTVDRVDDGMAP